jgi:Fe-S cluster assembly iron-binding protein IscA
MITCDAATIQAISETLTCMGATGPLRIELCFTGCCDPSLGLRVEAEKESDLVHDAGDVRFVMSTATADLVGDVTITHVTDGTKKRFILTSSIPVSEWDGFSACDIRDTTGE